MDKPKEEWIKVENTHPPIIDMETWELAQEIDRMTEDPRYNSLNETVYSAVCLLYGLRLCTPAQYGTAQRKNGSVAFYESYMCGNFPKRATACSTHRIYLPKWAGRYTDKSRDFAVKLAAHDGIPAGQSSGGNSRYKKTIKAVRKRLAELEAGAALMRIGQGGEPEVVCIELLNKYRRKRTGKSRPA